MSRRLPNLVSAGGGKCALIRNKAPFAPFGSANQRGMQVKRQRPALINSLVLLLTSRYSVKLHTCTETAMSERKRLVNKSQRANAPTEWSLFGMHGAARSRSSCPRGEGGLLASVCVAMLS